MAYFIDNPLSDNGLGASYTADELASAYDTAASIANQRYGQWTAPELVAIWTRGVHPVRGQATPGPARDMSYETAVEARKQVGELSTAHKAMLPPIALTNIAEWDKYVEKLTRVSAMSPEQYAAQKSQRSGSLLSQIFGGKKPTPATAVDAVKKAAGGAGGSGSYFTPSGSGTGSGSDSGTGKSNATTFLLLAAGAGALILLGSGNKKGLKRFSNPGGSAVRGAKRVLSWPKKILRKVGF